MPDTPEFGGAHHNRHHRHDCHETRKGLTVTHPIFDRHGLRHGHCGGAARPLKRDASHDASVTQFRVGVSRTNSASLQHFLHQVLAVTVVTQISTLCWEALS